MSSRHVCVWIDPRRAKVFALADGGVEKKEILAALRSGDRPDRLSLGRVQLDRTFLADIAQALGGAKGILVLGPGKARILLAGYLQEQHPRIAQRIWGSQACDHPADAGIVAQASRFFQSTRPMHG